MKIRASVSQLLAAASSSVLRAAASLGRFVDGFSLLHSATLSDTQTKDIGKNISDDVVADDATITISTTFSLSTSLTDSLSISDLIETQRGRPLSNSGYMVDSQTYSIGKLPSDVVLIAEQTAFAITTEVSDSISVTEALVTDAASSALTKAVSDGSTLADSHAAAFNKALQESLAVTDSLELTGLKGYADSGSISDASVVSVEIVQSDNASLTDSGSIINQGYCDITYFADDYVGVKRTF